MCAGLLGELLSASHPRVQLQLVDLLGQVEKLKSYFRKNFNPDLNGVQAETVLDLVHGREASSTTLSYL